MNIRETLSRFILQNLMSNPTAVQHLLSSEKLQAKIAEQDAEIAEQKSLVAEQKSLVADKDAEIAEQKSLVADKDAEIRRLQELVNKLSPCNPTP